MSLWGKCFFCLPHHKFNENNTRLHLSLYCSYIFLCRLMYLNVCSVQEYSKKPVLYSSTAYTYHTVIDYLCETSLKCTGISTKTSQQQKMKMVITQPLPYHQQQEKNQHKDKTTGYSKLLVPKNLHHWRKFYRHKEQYRSILDGVYLRGQIQIDKTFWNLSNDK